MLEEIGLLVIRLWAWGCVLAVLNSISQFAFSPRMKRIGRTIHSIAVCPIWPLALFSPEGRDVLFNRIQEL
jgi:hypothetical protein